MKVRTGRGTGERADRRVDRWTGKRTDRGVGRETEKRADKGIDRLNTQKKRFLFPAMLGMILIAGMVCPGVAKAATGEPVLQSRGKIVWEMPGTSLIWDTKDLHHIYQSLLGQKEKVIEGLRQVGTVVYQDGGKTGYDRHPERGRTEPFSGDIRQVDWSLLEEAISTSQNVPKAIPVRHPERALHLEGIAECTSQYEAAVADNISRGKAVWIQGNFVIGNGTDNEKAYQKGKEDGGNGKLPDGFLPIYEVAEAKTELRHVHIGKAENVDGTNGCYRNYATTHTTTSSCGAVLTYCEATWYPNPSEEGGGSWHGGYYTCGYHGGYYEGAGQCPYSETQSVTTWHHEISCGKEGLLYGTMWLSGTTGTEYDGSILLELQIEEGEGYPDLHWDSGKRCQWEDAEGNIIGEGENCKVTSPGEYVCRLLFANQEVDNRSTRASVAIVGLVKSCERAGFDN